MNTLTNTFVSSKIMYCGLGLVLTLVSGFVLSQLGRPLNSAIFTIHKLIAVGTVILIALSIRNFYTAGNVQPLHFVFIGGTGLLLLMLIVSGALLSFDKLATQPIIMIHQIVPLLVLTFSAITAYLLMGSKS